MLYSPKWEQLKSETMRHFLRWVEEQPADQRYPWLENEHCACGQYARSIGVRGWSVSKLPPFWSDANYIARGRGLDDAEWTFGRLATRLRNHIEETEKV